MGALAHLPLVEYDDVRDAVSDADLVLATTSGRARERRALLTPRTVRNLIETRRPRRVAIVFGNEHSGLSAAELRCCHALCRVSTTPGFGVLNLGQAVAVVLALLTEGTMPPPPSPDDADHPASAEEFAAALEQLQELLSRSGFLDPTNPERIMDRLRLWLGAPFPAAGRWRSCAPSPPTTPTSTVRPGGSDPHPRRAQRAGRGPTPGGNAPPALPQPPPTRPPPRAPPDEGG